MTRLINEATLHRREGTGRSHGPQGPRPLGRARWPLFPTQITQAPLLLPSLSFLHPGSISAKQRSDFWESDLSLHLASSAPCFRESFAPGPGEKLGEGEARAHVRAHRAERSAARAYLAKALATPEQLRVPAGYLALIAQPGPNQRTRSRHCPGVGVGYREFAW